MKKLKSGVLALLILIMLVAGIAFALLNPQTVELDLFFVRVPPVSVALLMLAALVTGLVLGVVLSGLGRAGRQIRKRTLPAEASR
ncbi:MAG: LapA family protein [Gammaproteobacteria bacterium]|nr:MAG: LapA family protein [Gammaproteobacteria bacterium]